MNRAVRVLIAACLAACISAGLALNCLAENATPKVTNGASVSVLPKITFPKIRNASGGVVAWTTPITVTVSIKDEQGAEYTTQVIITGGATTGTFLLEGIPSGRNYIITATAVDAAGQWSILRALIPELSADTQLTNVTVSSETSVIADVVERVASNLGISVSALPQATIQAIQTEVASNPSLDPVIIANKYSAGSVSGTVTDTLNGLPVAGVQVTIPDVSLSVVTDAAGEFGVQGVPARSGPLTVSFAKAGYRPQAGSVQVAVGGNSTLNVQLEPNPAVAVVVSAPSSSVFINRSIQLGAEGRDAQGNAVAVRPTWSIVQGPGDGTLSETGAFTGTALGAVTVKATAGTASGTLTLTVIEPPSYALSLAVSGQGTVTKTPDSATYVDGSTVQLTATPASGWAFDRWTGDLTGSANPATVTMTGAKSVTAVLRQTLITVPVDYPTIQAALDASRAGDTIVVQPGTYRENINFKGKGVTLRSANPTDLGTVQSTIIDGNGTGSVVAFKNGESASAVIDGFTIRNGTGTISSSGRRHGGGIYVTNSSPTIRNNIITENTVPDYGGGIFISQATPLVQKNTVENNAAGTGGGIYVSSGSPTVLQNVIRLNTASSSGGGIRTGEDGANPLIDSNTLEGNRAVAKGGAIAVNNYAAPVIRNNVMAGNASDGPGGAIHVSYHASPQIDGNTFNQNAGVYYGGAIFVTEDSTVRDRNGNPWLRMNSPPYSEPANVYGTGMSANQPDNIRHHDFPPDLMDVTPYDKAVVNTPPPSVHIGLEDPGSGPDISGTQVQLSLDGQPTAFTRADYPDAIEVSPLQGWADGSYEVQVTARDQIGIQGTYTFSFMLDQAIIGSPPTVAISSSASGGTVRGSVPIDYVVSPDVERVFIEWGFRTMWECTEGQPVIYEWLYREEDLTVDGQYSWDTTRATTYNPMAARLYVVSTNGLTAMSAPIFVNVDNR